MANLKQNTVETGRIASENIVLKCGDCMHFQNSPHPGIGQACELRGVKKFATAPNCYTANVHVFRKTSPQTLTLLSSIVSSFSPSQTKVLMGLLKQQAALQRHNLTFMQKVYFCVGNDFLENYFAGFVLSTGPKKEILIVGSQFHSNQKNSVVAALFRDSIFTKEEFVKHKSRLESQGLLYETRKPKSKLPENLGEYEPPTLETPQALLESKATSNPKKKKKTVTMLEIRDSNV
jgi:hypothetical protein